MSDTADLKRLQGATERGSDASGYKGLGILSDGNLHQKCFELVESLSLDKKKARALVLASGSGAFEQRLYDDGFTDITSIDFRPDFFKATAPVKFIEHDLNADFPDIGRFDLIVATEIIEHVENPSHFLRNIARALTDTGHAIISTPNLESGLSRAGFLILGRLSFYTPADLQGSGHISPIIHHIFEFLAGRAGLRIVKHTYNRNAWGQTVLGPLRSLRELIAEPSLSHARTALLFFLKTFPAILFWPLTRINARDGNLHIYLLNRDK